MKESLLFALIFFIISTCLAKLIYKTTDKPISKIVSEARKPDVIAKDPNGAAVNFYNIKQRNARNPAVTSSPRNITKAKSEKKKVLVKKPIPKYHDANSDEDYQVREKWPESQDSAEHEDEDFNINDYDFDVNHDEFVSGRKPLEPRTKFVDKPQRSQGQKANKVLKPKIPRSLVQKKNIFPRNINLVDFRNAGNKMREEDYDQEFLTTTQIPKETRYEKDDEDESDEFEDSKEYSRPAVRIVRSPWHIGLGAYVDKLGEKTTSVMSKLLSILPIFPQVPQAKKIAEEMPLIDEPVKNPLRGR